MEPTGVERHRPRSPRGEGERTGSERINAFGVWTRPISHSVARVVCVLLSQCPEFMKDRSHLRILTVEDEPAVTQMLALLLGGPAAKVTSASDGWMALMKIGAAAKPFDVIITDHNMRRVNGLELVRRLRVREFAGKIIVLSAHLTKENIQAYEELKVDMMLAKPFDVEELQLAMSLLTKKPSAPVTAPLAAQA
jgi:CheY-like chemotaxis protein